MNTTQLAPRSDLRSLVQSDKVRAQLMDALPKYFTAEQFAVIVRTSINKNPKLLECTPESFLVSVLTAAQMGIAPDGRNGYLIPRFNSKANAMECNFQPSYIGKVGLVRKNDNVADVYAELVCENDFIEVTKGLRRDIIHKIDIKADRGAIIGVYAVIIYKDETRSFEYLNQKDIEGIRAHSDSWKAHVAKGYSTPWKDDEGEMWKKSALNRLLKLADLSPDTATRLSIDADAEVERLPQTQIARAQIHGIAQPALTDGEFPAAQDDGETHTTAANLPVEKRKPGRPSLKVVRPDAPATKPAAEAAKPTAPDSLAGQVEAALAQDGFVVADLMRAVVANNWPGKDDIKDPEAAPLTVIPDTALTILLEDWDSVKEALVAAQSPQKQ